MNINQEILKLVKEQSVTVSKIPDLIQSHNGLKESVDCINGSIKEIQQELGGSKLGGKGLIEQVTTLKTNHYDLESRHEKLVTKIYSTKNLAIIGGSLILLLLSYLTYLQL